MLSDFITILKTRNETLYLFGLICLIAAGIFFLLSLTTNVRVFNINAWIKPFKFALSTFFFSWAMAWYIGYLANFNPSIFNWMIIITLGFEIIYIALQASKGQLSHFNVSSPTYAILYSLMGTAATVATLATAYIGIKFFTADLSFLPDHYLWSIRLGIIIFVIFSFEGFVMGTKMTHTIGGPDGGEGIPVLNWSTRFGDPRVAHFIGMHALQILPLLSYFIFQNTKATIAIAILYFLLAIFTLVQALKGKPFIRLEKKR